ncbi:MAG: hypothetical protein COA90_04970 [Gammaproteobacteria bacterium]|nr:MAG: hypothetical protein COA90_04970 [Gammaproteobacteria bacterium]
MMIFKKHAVWMILLLTLLASVWTSQQDSGDKKPVTSRPPLLYPVSAVKLEASVGQDSVDVPTSFMSQGLITRPYISDKPSHLFSPLTLPQTDLEYEHESVADSVPIFTLPVNPYVFAGKLVEGNHVYIFLSDGVNNHTVTVGDMIDDEWRVEAISPAEMILENIEFKTEVIIHIGALS